MTPNMHTRTHRYLRRHRHAARKYNSESNEHLALGFNTSIDQERKQDDEEEREQEQRPEQDRANMKKNCERKRNQRGLSVFSKITLNNG